MKEKLLNVFNKLKNNSIGENKKVKSNRRKITVTLKKSIATMLTIMTAATFVGCNSKKQNTKYNKENFSVSNMTLDDEFNGFKYDEVVAYEQDRVIDLLDTYNMNDYTIVNGKRNYNYVSEDYEKMGTLNDTYIRGFYVLTTDNTVTEVTKALGYDGINDYMQKKGYKTENEWIYDDLNTISSMMSIHYSKSK